MEQGLPIKEVEFLVKKYFKKLQTLLEMAGTRGTKTHKINKSFQP